MKIPPVRGFSSPQLLLDPNPAAGRYVIAQDPPQMDFHILEFPGSPQPGECWSCWGQGWLSPDGRLYFAAGNHLESGGRGNSHLYCYDAGTGRLNLAVDIRKVAEDAGIAAGKIHGTIGEGNDHKIYFATYWGAELKDAARNDFKGAALISYDPRTGTAEYLGLPCKGEVFRAAALDSERMLLYLIALPSRSLLCYDIASGSAVYRSPGDYALDDRSLFVDPQGNVLFSFDQGKLGLYDREGKKIHRLKEPLSGRSLQKLRNLIDPQPAPFLRCMAASPGSRLGYGITAQGRLFSLNLSTHDLHMMGSSFMTGEYVATLAISRDGRFLYYAPGSLGNAANLGVPVVQYNIASRQLKVIAFLGAHFLKQFEYRPGGCYSISIGENGRTLYLVLNGTPVCPGIPVDQQPPFGQPCLVILDIPESECR